jgi:hypothetical protein
LGRGSISRSGSNELEFIPKGSYGRRLLSKQRSKIFEEEKGEETAMIGKFIYTYGAHEKDNATKEEQ